MNAIIDRTSVHDGRPFQKKVQEWGTICGYQYVLLLGEHNYITPDTRRDGDLVCDPAQFEAALCPEYELRC